MVQIDSLVPGKIRAAVPALADDLKWIANDA
jgi:hypothetical protein